jgi:hypothetical protein
LNYLTKIIFENLNFNDENTQNLIRGTLDYGPSKSWANFGAIVLVGKFYWLNFPLDKSPSPLGFLS